MLVIHTETAGWRSSHATMAAALPRLVSDRLRAAGGFRVQKSWPVNEPLAKCGSEAFGSADHAIANRYRVRAKLPARHDPRQHAIGPCQRPKTRSPGVGITCNAFRSAR
jgi:hypothetical protein